MEREIVRRFRAEGIPALRVPLSGATEHSKGDIEILRDVLTQIGEVKARKDFPKWMPKFLGDNDFLVLRPDKQEPMVIMEFVQFCWLLREAAGIPHQPGHRLVHHTSAEELILVSREKLRQAWADASARDPKSRAAGLLWGILAPHEAGEAA